jgi:cytochrome c-type biogenesis protein CcmH
MLIDARDLAWFLAGLFSGIALVVLLRPRLGRLYAGRTAATLLKAPLIIAALIVVFAIALFVWLMSPGPPAGAAGEAVSTQANAPASAPSAPASAASMDELLQGLESRLATQGGTDADWELLAQTYEFMGRAADAQGARSHQLPASARAAVVAAGDAQPAPPPADGAAADSAQLQGAVELAAPLKSRVPAGLTLFIIAKAVDSPGPPVAVLRTTTSRWPLRFSLDDASAMVPDRKLSTAGPVTVEARVSRSGQATPQSGDFQSALMTVNPRERKSVRLVIDHVIG